MFPRSRGYPSVHCLKSYFSIVSIAINFEDNNLIISVFKIDCFFEMCNFFVFYVGEVIDELPEILFIAE